ncbi:MAG: AAA family ATPase [Psychromonas sp.]|nr:AAA family ATPase [Psychromonas sp.]
MVVRQLIALPSQQLLIDRLQHMIYLSSSLIFVSGAQGAGKSTLIEQLSNSLQDDVQEVFIQLNEQLSDSQIRQQIIVQLYDKPLFDDQDSLFSSIALLQEKYNRDVPRLIILDNAQYLSTDLLAELSELIAQKYRILRNEVNVLLLADGNSTQQMLLSLNQACTCLEFKLEALSRDEAKRLLSHIFKQAGYQHQIQNQDALLKQLTACAGIPEKIIVLAEKIIAGELVSCEPSWLKTRLPAFALMLFLLTVAAGLASYLYPIFIKPVRSSAEVKEAFTKKRGPVLSVSKEALPAEEQRQMVEELAGSWKEEGLANIDENPLQVGEPDIDSQDEVISKATGIAPAVSEKLAPGVVKIVKETSPEENEVQEKPQSRDTQEVASLKEDNTLTKTAQTVIGNKAVEAEAAVILPIKSEKLASEKTLDSIFTAKSALLSVPASHYTLQLSAMASEDTLQRFISEHGLPKENVHIYKTRRNSKPWYVVIFGEYNSWKAAKKASKNLPDLLATPDSWIKKYQLVHQDLQLNNE